MSKKFLVDIIFDSSDTGRGKITIDMNKIRLDEILTCIEKQKPIGGEE